jgi:hypothetical protein
VAHSQGDHRAARALYGESLTIGLELGAVGEIAYWLNCLGGLARMAAAQGQCERAARLFGTAERCSEGMNHPLLPADRAEHDRSIAAVRATLGESAFAAAWAEGWAMPFDQAVAYALEEIADG